MTTLRPPAVQNGLYITILAQSVFWLALSVPFASKNHKILACALCSGSNPYQPGPKSYITLSPTRSGPILTSQDLRAPTRNPRPNKWTTTKSHHHTTYHHSYSNTPQCRLTTLTTRYHKRYTTSRIPLRTPMSGLVLDTILHPPSNGSRHGVGGGVNPSPKGKKGVGRVIL